MLRRFQTWRNLWSVSKLRCSFDTVFLFGACWCACKVPWKNVPWPWSRSVTRSLWRWTSEWRWERCTYVTLIIGRWLKKCSEAVLCYSIVFHWFPLYIFIYWYILYSIHSQNAPAWKVGPYSMVLKSSEVAEAGVMGCPAFCGKRWHQRMVLVLPG